jgi:glycosyltransferase involved in cell wall biosynthesis
MREQSLAANIGRPDQYVTIYSGMDTKPFLNPPVPREQVRRELKIAEDDVIVGTIARLFELKGHDDLLDIAPELCARFPKLRFMWIGDGLLRPQFERRIAEMKLTNRFILTGLVPPAMIPQLVNAMDIVVHPSRREGLARALPQGELAGCPVVTYDIDGNREALVDGETGYLLPPFDKNKLADAIARLVSDASLRRSMGERGREFALRRFDSNVMVDALENLYQNAHGAAVGA